MINNKYVALGPKIDLHTGYHGAIVDTPPAGIILQLVAATHTFIHEAGDTFSPHRDTHLGEFITVDQHDGIVHSARWPVLNSPAWITDTDDLMYPILCGRTAYNPSYRAQIRNPSNLGTIKALRCRVENMIAGYVHPSCLGILLRGHATNIVHTRQWLDWLGVAVDDAFLGKITLVRPAQRAMPREAFDVKWKDDATFKVTFCGRDFDYKNGHLAIRVMRRIMNAYPFVQFTYIGNIPSEVLANDYGLLSGIDHYPSMTHHDVIIRLRQSHLFFHPSKGDSVGISLLEAMGAGLAVVVARGGAMAYSDELFATGGARMLERNGSEGKNEEDAFFQLVKELVIDRSLSYELGSRNYEATRSGEYSIDVQNRRLAKFYMDASNSTGSSRLRLSDLPHARDKAVALMSSAEVWNDARLYREQLGVGSDEKCVIV